MADHIVQKSALVTCDHQGQAQPQLLTSRVKIGGEPAVVVPQSYSVVACPLTTNAGPAPCATITFANGTTRVKTVEGALLLKGAQGTAIGPLPAQGGASINAVQKTVSAE